MNVNSVNNYQQYRKEYIRLSTAINRGKQNGLDMSELLTQRNQLKNVYSIQYTKPNSVYNNERIQSPVNKVYKPQTVYRVNNEELKTLVLELKTQLEKFSQQITISLTEIKEQLTNTLTQLTNKLTKKVNSNFQPKPSSSPKIKIPPTKLTPAEWLEKRRAYDRARNKSPHRRAQLAQYKKNARARKKLEKELKNSY